MEIVRLALANERSRTTASTSSSRCPASPIGVRTVQELTLVPRPAAPVRDLAGGHQPADPRVRARRRPRRRVLEPALLFIKRFWDTLRRALRRAHDGAELAAGEKRMLVIAVRVEDTHERGAAHRARRATTSSGSSSGPYGWSRGYMGDDGKPAKPGLIPTLDDVDRATRRSSLGTPERRGRGRAVLPRPARRRAPHDLPAPARRPVQEGRRADGPLHRRGRPAPALTARECVDLVTHILDIENHGDQIAVRPPERRGQRRLRWTAMSDDPAAGQPAPPDGPPPSSSPPPPPPGPADVGTALP